MHICEHCIAAIKSRGEQLMVSSEPVEDAWFCDWCEEEENEVYEVEFT